jgi:hypothetical protein
MLTAYRRTLSKTMEQARSMGEVVQEPEVAVLADTPDKAVVWGLALGLHDEVSEVLARGLEEQVRSAGSPAGAYYPVWLGSTHSSAWSAASAGPGGGPGSISAASGSMFSGSAVPDLGGMFSALGSVGSTPPSSSSSSGGGGFSGGGGGGGGGASGSF